MGRHAIPLVDPPDPPPGLPSSTRRRIWSNISLSPDEADMNHVLQSWRVALVVGILLVTGAAATATAQAPTVPEAGASARTVVFAAASLKNALDDIGAAWTASTAKAIAVSYAASSALARQIEQDAPADVFILADLDWMDYLAARKLIRPETRTNLLGNQLVIIAPKADARPLVLGPGFDLAKALGGGRLAMADVKTVPAGKYGKAALEKIGAWAGVGDKIAQTENVRAALVLVARGEAPLGIVYRSDAVADPTVAIVATFPQDSHPPIIYPVAVTQRSVSRDAMEFVTFLKSPTSASIFQARGFTVLP
jgi:molybdate transport system substrate-binding protein